jgi:hypothetical protein
MPSQKIKVVYLDQKCWIDIAKLYFGEMSEQDSNLVKKLLEASEKGQMIFPLSLSHIDETNRITDDKRRNQLAFLMAKISRGYSLQPYFNRLLRAEIRNIVLRKLGLNAINIRDYVLKKGISNLLGAKPTLVPRKNAPSSELPEDVKKKLLDLLESSESIELALQQRPPKSIDENKREVVKRMEKIRHDISAIKDNNLRQRVFLARNMIEIVGPELAKILLEHNLPRDFFLKEKSTRKDIDELLDNMPTALCLFTLIYQRDQQLQRPIEVNDFNDIWFLTLAIPYSDIVVTEKMWVSIATRTKLDRKCNTILLSSIYQLESHL